MPSDNSVNERKLISELEQRRSRLIDRAADEPSQQQRDGFLREIHEITQWISSLRESSNSKAAQIRANAAAEEQDHQAKEQDDRLAEIGRKLA